MSSPLPFPTLLASPIVHLTVGPDSAAISCHLALLQQCPLLHPSLLPDPFASTDEPHSPIHLPTESIEAVTALVQFLYTGNYVLSDPHNPETRLVHLEVLHLAQNTELPKLVELAEEFLKAGQWTLDALLRCTELVYETTQSGDAGRVEHSTLVWKAVEMAPREERSKLRDEMMRVPEFGADILEVALQDDFPRKQKSVQRLRRKREEPG